MIVRIAEVGGSLKEVEVSNWATVSDALAKAGLSNENPKEIRVNANRAETTTPLREHDVILLVPRVEGGR
jgi:molybdopterin converting factor small subunit